MENTLYTFQITGEQKLHKPCLQRALLNRLNVFIVESPALLKLKHYKAMFIGN